MSPKTINEFSSICIDYVNFRYPGRRRRKVGTMKGCVLNLTDSVAYAVEGAALPGSISDVCKLTLFDLINALLRTD